MTDSPAIFLSYAHEDAEAARKIAEALRAFGLQVWFDANELRGGDQWDANIRRQIKNCALFIPIVSASTQARREAYFRLEWKLADDRTHMMAPGTPFIVPIVIDDTLEYEAKVPESFTKAQFTRLAGGEPTPEFVADVKRLASDPTASVAKPSQISPRPAPPPTTPLSPSRKSPVLMIVGMSIAGAIVLMGMMMWYASNNKKTTTSRITAATEAAEVAEAAGVAEETTAADRLSIAVLPFTNMSDDPSANSFFADGIHEDLLTSLSYIGELKVVSRTSVMQYRDTTKPVKQIAGELGVGTLLEGSVRRAGDQVRVTAQLIDASADEHIWAQNYDRKLEDIFAIQGELATAITNALRVALTDEQAEAFTNRPTQNIEAYELFLKEQDLTDTEGNTQDRLWRSIAMMQSAVEMDSEFAVAWANLGTLHAQAYFWGYDQSESRRELATTAIERAIKLGPDDLDVMTYVGSYFYYGYRNYRKAAEFYQKVLDEAPNHVDALASMGFIRRREGQWRESIRYHERVLELDPRNISVATGLTTTYEWLRQWDKAVEMQQIVVEQNPGELVHEGTLATFKAERDISYLPLAEFIERHEHLKQTDNVWFSTYRLNRAISDRDWAAAIEEATNRSDQNDPGLPFIRAILYRIDGQEDKATESLEEILESVNPDRWSNDESWRYFFKAFALELLGRTDEAQATVSDYNQFLEDQNDAIDRSLGPATGAIVSVWSDPPEVAIAKIRAYLRAPGRQVISRYNLRDSIFVYPLWGHPEFEALIEDDEAWAPLLAD
ncbi:MAG: hypothetical protein SynsKO_28340 [Synoicihabitans sp.]